MSLLTSSAGACRRANRTLLNPVRFASSNSKPPRPKGFPGIHVAVTTGLAFAFTVGAIYYIRAGEGSAETLQPVSFTPFALASKQYVSSTSSIFLLWPSKLSQQHDPYGEAWRRGIWSVQFKQPQLQIARAYTPLPPSPSLTENPVTTEELRFLIRKDSAGEVSSYLHALAEGSTLEVRGPHFEYEIPPETEKLLFLAGGTGIAPALQAAHCLLEARRDGRRRSIHIMWANRRREDCSGGQGDSLEETPWSGPWWLNLISTIPPSTSSTSAKNEPKSLIVRQLEQLKVKYPHQISVDYFVDEERTFIDESSVTESLKKFDVAGSGLKHTGGYVTESDRNGSTPAHEGSSKQLTTKPKALLLISGPDGFVKCLAGPKAWHGGKEVQGPLEGILSRQPLGHLQVWKL